MSHWIYLQCESHNPPMRADDESGQHLNADLPQAVDMVRRREEVVAEFDAFGDDPWTAMDGFDWDRYRRNTTWFLAKHRSCLISIVGEYGDVHLPATPEKKAVTTDGHDIHEAVQILYDIAHNSMDWGSGFLDNEEMVAVIGLGIEMGWELPPLPDNGEVWQKFAREHPDHYEIVETTHQRPLYKAGVYLDVAGREWPSRVKIGEENYTVTTIKVKKS